MDLVEYNKNIFELCSNKIISGVEKKEKQGQKLSIRT